MLIIGCIRSIIGIGRQAIIEEANCDLRGNTRQTRGLDGLPAPELRQNKGNISFRSLLTAGADGITVLTSEKGCAMADLLRSLWSDDQGQDIAEYAVMLAVILVLVVGTIRLVGSNANNVFSQVGSSLNN